MTAGLRLACVVVGGASVLGLYLWHRAPGAKVQLSLALEAERRANRPRRIYLMRHGESQGNVDKNVFTTVPDHAIPLTANGRQQARLAGMRLKQMIGDETCRFWISPYVRTRQTFEEVAAAFATSQYTSREEPRLREQDWGNFQDTDLIRECRSLRDRFGAFFYRIPAGESGADVFDRVSSFLESLHRDFQWQRAQNVVLISHGLTCRLFLMRFLHWPFEKFERTYNLGNCEVLILEKRGPAGRYSLITPVCEDIQPVEDEWGQIAAERSSFAQAPSTYPHHRKVLTSLA